MKANVLLLFTIRQSGQLLHASGRSAPRYQVYTICVRLSLSWDKISKIYKTNSRAYPYLIKERNPTGRQDFRAQSGEPLTRQRDRTKEGKE